MLNRSFMVLLEWTIIKLASYLELNTESIKLTDISFTGHPVYTKQFSYFVTEQGEKVSLTRHVTSMRLLVTSRIFDGNKGYAEVFLTQKGLDYVRDKLRKGFSTKEGMVEILGGDPFVQRSLELCSKYKGIISLLKSDIPIKVHIKTAGGAVSAARWGKAISNWSIEKTNPLSLKGYRECLPQRSWGILWIN